MGTVILDKAVTEGYLTYLSNHFDLSDISKGFIEYVLSNYQHFQFFPGTSREFSKFNELVGGSHSLSGIKKAFYALVKQGCIQKTGRGLYVLNASLFPLFLANARTVFVVYKITSQGTELRAVAANPSEEVMGEPKISVLPALLADGVKTDFPEVEFIPFK
ncbi:MAG TPA: hypothetical protein DCY51_11240 [Bacteroidetes bacterium]|nr:hypothetical protein [Bacteroidota bacterium]